MIFAPAPLYEDAAQGPAGGEAVWADAPDGTRLRLAHWPAMERATGPARGTVLLFTGRSEYVEKYGPTARALTEAGWHLATLDWRGQGLAARRHPDPMLGHVQDFAEYQQDVACLMGFVRARGLPEPLHLLSHSMGGCIALRALLDGLPVRSAAFSAPMWGIRVFPFPEPMAVSLAATLHRKGQGLRLTPTTMRASYVLQAGFRWNMLTRDREMWHWMRQHMLAHPDLALGGPSITWLDAAFREMRALAQAKSPALPAYTALGTSERIICPRMVKRRMADWPGGQLDLYPRSEHEVMMEVPIHRDRFHKAVLALFAASPP
ncbi:alpha/beta fold hydrolase [Gemmobacter serpentinus]|uniref:alpha/beta fold hydrolase n=1 Tax=Gemmobacter serpentinus TaxID=2652247 RepID=UPI00124E2B68|nr:alpha/beta hydrolase [Gemmobacter serpentinus]